VYSVKHPHLRVEYLRDEVKKVNSNIEHNESSFSLHLDNHIVHEYAASSAFDKHRICDLIENLSLRTQQHKRTNDKVIRHGYVVAEIDSHDSAVAPVLETLHTTRWMELSEDALLLYAGPREPEPMYVMLLEHVRMVDIPQGMSILDLGGVSSSSFAGNAVDDPATLFPFNVHIAYVDKIIAHRFWSRSSTGTLSNRKNININIVFFNYFHFNFFFFNYFHFIIY
jgi:hypothetical protein